MKSKKELIEELNWLMQQTNTLSVLHTNAVANKIGLSATEFEALDVVSRNQPVTAGQLASRCGLTTGAITGIVDRLERAGVVCRRRDPNDRRKVLLEPIDNRSKSKKIRKLYQPLHHAFEELMVDCTPEQIEFLIEVHRKMNEATEKIISDMYDK